MSATGSQRIAHARSAPPPKRQFSLAQLMAILCSTGLLMAAGRVLGRIDDSHPWEWIVVFVSFVAISGVLFATRLALVGHIVFSLGLIFGLIGLIAPALGTAKHAARRSACQGHLKQIVVALHSYHDDYGCFPPAVVRDPSGRPLHSWRVLLLPYLEQQKLHAQYRFDEPWDGPNNKKLHGAEVLSYACPDQPGRGSQPITDTSYVVIVGPRTAFPENGCVRLSDITDDPGNTLLVVEIAGSGIHWMEPRDLHVTQMARTINPAKGQGISSQHKGGANAVMADGSVQLLDAEKLTAKEVESLLSIDGNVPPLQATRQ